MIISAASLQELSVPAHHQKKAILIERGNFHCIRELFRLQNLAEKGQLVQKPRHPHPASLALSQPRNHLLAHQPPWGCITQTPHTPNPATSAPTREISHTNLPAWTSLMVKSRDGGNGGVLERLRTRPHVTALSRLGQAGWVCCSARRGSSLEQLRGCQQRVRLPLRGSHHTEHPKTPAITTSPASNGGN